MAWILGLNCSIGDRWQLGVVRHCCLFGLGPSAGLRWVVRPGSRYNLLHNRLHDLFHDLLHDLLLRLLLRRLFRRLRWDLHEPYNTSRHWLEKAGTSIMTHIRQSYDNELDLDRKYAQMTTRAQSSWIDDLAHDYSHNCHESFSNLPRHNFYEEHTAKLPQWYKKEYWIWQRERCLFLFVVSRLLRTIHTADRTSGHELLLEPASLRPWRSHTVYSLASFQSSNHIQFITFQSTPHAICITH